jgi:2-C-methyl-D-erythritol 2,4-cyclodiphosphate synthase
MLRIGEGWDLHQLTEGRALMLGGIKIPSKKGEVAHSDGDVLIHAIIDSILGAFADGDIGSHFPDTDPLYKDCNSVDLLKKVLATHPFNLCNIDCTVTLQTPKLRPFINSIQESLAEALEANLNQISIKAKTAEQIGPIGEGNAIEARAIVLIEV